jgi:type VI protein secretion system component VasK
MSGNYGGKYAPRKKNPLKPFYPVIGLLILILGGGFAYYVSPSVTTWLDVRMEGTFPPQMRLVVAGVIFLVIVMVLGTIFSAFQPRTPKGVSEKDLDKEKQERVKEQQAAAKRRKEMQSKMRRRNRENSENKP